MADDGQLRPPRPGDLYAVDPRMDRERFGRRLLAIAAVALVVLLILAVTFRRGGETEPDPAAEAAAIVDSNVAPPDLTLPTITAAPAVPQSPTGLYPDRLNRQELDQEQEVGRAVELSGYRTTVDSAVFVQSVSAYDRAGYLKATVTVVNRDQAVRSFNPFDWQLQTPGGTLRDPIFFPSVGSLTSGKLVPGGSVSGDLYFPLAGEKGVFYLAYMPGASDVARGIWGVSL